MRWRFAAPAAAAAPRTRRPVSGKVSVRAGMVGVLSATISPADINVRSVRAGDGSIDCPTIAGASMLREPLRAPIAADLASSLMKPPQADDRACRPRAIGTAVALPPSSQALRSLRNVDAWSISRRLIGMWIGPLLTGRLYD